MKSESPDATMRALLLVSLLGMPATEGLPGEGPLLDGLPKGMRLLFQGDSITDGNRGRNDDLNHIIGHGYVYLIAARNSAALPEHNLTFLNRGVSGDTVRDLAQRWRPDTLDLKPDLLSVLIGINDAIRRVPLNEYEQTYDRLLLDARCANPRLRLVLCEPFTLPVGSRKEDYAAWRAEVGKRQEVVARLARKHGAALVPFQAVFDAACRRARPEYWIWDGIHPTFAGHQLMADAWARSVRSLGPVQAGRDSGKGP